MHEHTGTKLKTLWLNFEKKYTVTIIYYLSKKTILNEFVAYTHLAEMIKPGGIELQKRSVVIVTYALCGFSNLSSIAIQIGGIGSIAPERRSDLAKLEIQALIAGSLACFMTANIAGFLL